MDREPSYASLDGTSQLTQCLRQPEATTFVTPGTWATVVRKDKWKEKGKSSIPVAAPELAACLSAAFLLKVAAAAKSTS